MKRFIIAGLIWIIAGLSVYAKGHAELVFSTATAKPGETVWAGVHLKLDPGWHTYWLNPGDSGQEATIEWVLPPGIKAGSIQWPIPDKLNSEGLITYVYHDEVLLLVPLEIGTGTAKGSLPIKANVRWLECEKSCLPARGTVEGALVVGDQSQASPAKEIIEQWKSRLPTSEKTTATVAWDGAAAGDSRTLAIHWKTNAPNSDFYPARDAHYEISNETERKVEGAEVVLKKIVKKSEGDWPSEIAGLLVAGAVEKAKPAVGYEVKFTLASGSGAGVTVPPPAKSASSTPVGVAENAPRSLLAMLGLAFLGGLILNIMPCVLPVIALKILGFVNQSHEDRAQVRKMGLVYGLGVLVSFLVLAAIVIGVKQAGRAATWGMQFQNPQFLIVLTTLVTLVALNLFGIFEVNLGGRAMGAASQIAAKEGVSGAFFNGVLATALATPCSAPALGIALGFAFAQTPFVIILMFLSVGLGLAAPYVVLSCQPAWLKFLPKPGAWMEKFKIAMGFPMLATAVWLFGLAIGHFDRHAPFWIGIFLVLVAMAAWVWGEFVQRGSKRHALSILVCAGLIAFGYFYVLEGQVAWREARKPVARGALANKPGEIQWERWSPEAVAKLRAEGRPIFIDFTADWCTTCQVNKRTSIEIKSVREKLKAINAAALIGDFSDEDPAIAAELQRFQRAAVPLVLVYPVDPAAPPIVLPEILRPSIVLNALEQAAGPKRTAANQP